MFWLTSHIITTVIICMVALQVIMFGSFLLHEYAQIFQKECPGFMQECNFFVGNGACFSCLSYLFHCLSSDTADSYQLLSLEASLSNTGQTLQFILCIGLLCNIDIGDTDLSFFNGLS